MTWGGARRGSGPAKTTDELLARELSRRERVIGSPLSAAEIHRFERKVDRRGEDECWPWNGSRLKPYGYGRLTIRSRITGAFSVELAPRLALWIATGTAPKLFVLHSCDNPPCCNPKHLREGTQGENIVDAMTRGRLILPAPRRGETNPANKLTELEVIEIRERVSLGAAVRAVARAYGVSKTTVQRIVDRHVWKHVP